MAATRNEHCLHPSTRYTGRAHSLAAARNLYLSLIALNIIVVSLLVAAIKQSRSSVNGVLHFAVSNMNRSWSGHCIHDGGYYFTNCCGAFGPIMRRVTSQIRLFSTALLHQSSKTIDPAFLRSASDAPCAIYQSVVQLCHAPAACIPVEISYVCGNVLSHEHATRGDNDGVHPGS